MHFLTQTFRNVFYVHVGKRYARLWRLLALASGRLRRLAVRRKLEDAGRRWHRSHAHCRRRRPAGMQTELQFETATSAGVILPETGQFLLLC